MSAYDLGCVKTQKSQNRRELFFSDQAKANTLKNSRRYNCDSEKRSFYRRRAPLRFYTAKTHLRHHRERFVATHKPAELDGSDCLYRLTADFQNFEWTTRRVVIEDADHQTPAIASEGVKVGSMLF